MGRHPREDIDMQSISGCPQAENAAQATFTCDCQVLRVSMQTFIVMVHHNAYG